MSGTTTDLSFTGSQRGDLRTTYRYEFSGAFSGAEIVGAYTLTITTPATGPSSARLQVTLR